MRFFRKGIILITTLLLISVIIMISAILIVTGRNTLLLGGNYSDKEQAYFAAESGLAYVQFAISKCIDWISDEPMINGLYNPGYPDISIEVVPGQTKVIHGRLINHNSEFYVAFYSNSWTNSCVRTDEDGMPLRYYSYNNLSNGTNSMQSVFWDGINAKVFKTVPKLTANIIIEGRCNLAKRYVEAMLCYDDTERGSACTITAGGIDIGLSDPDSVFLVNTAKGSESKIRSLGDIKVRSNDTLNAKKNCFQVANNGTSCTGKYYENKYTYINNQKIDSPDKQKEFGLTCENSNQSSYIQNARLSWPDVTADYMFRNPQYQWIQTGKHAWQGYWGVTGYDTGYNSNVKARISSGAWVYKNSPQNPSTYNLYYYPASLTNENQKNFVNVNSLSETPFKQELIQGDAKSIEIVSQIRDMKEFSMSGDYMFNIKSPVGVKEGTNYRKNNFALMIYDYDPGSTPEKPKYYPSTNYRTSLRISPPEEKTPLESETTLKKNKLSNVAFISDTGMDIRIDGELSGNGKIISGGHLTFQGNSLLAADPGSGLSIYSRGSVNINPVKGSGGSKDPNSSIKKALTNFISKNSLKNSGGFYTSGLKDYKELRDELLKTIVGTKVVEVEVVDPDSNFVPGIHRPSISRVKTDITLLDELTDKNGLNYDTAGAQELVSAMLAKNSYMGEDMSPPKTNEVELEYENAFTYGDYKVVCAHGTESNNSYIKILDEKAQKMDVYEIKDGKINNTPLPPSAIEGSSSKDWKPLGKTSLNANTLINPADWKGNVKLTLNDTGENLSFDMNNEKWTFKYDTAARNRKSETINVVDPSSNDFKILNFNDTIIKGMIYTWEDLYGPNLQGGSFNVRGGIVAYGGDPSYQNPGDNQKGKVQLNNAKYVTFTYDPDYMHMTFDMLRGINTKRIFYAYF